MTEARWQPDYHPGAEWNSPLACRNYVERYSPKRKYVGTRYHAFVEVVTGPTSYYDIWVSTYADAHGTIRLGTGWMQLGKLLFGQPGKLRLYLFVIHTAADDKPSRPSAPKQILLQVDFPFT